MPISLEGSRFISSDSTVSLGILNSLDTWLQYPLLWRLEVWGPSTVSAWDGQRSSSSVDAALVNLRRVDAAWATDVGQRFSLWIAVVKEPQCHFSGRGLRRWDWWAPVDSVSFLSLAYLELLTLEGGFGLNRRQSSASFCNAFCSFCVILESEEPIVTKALCYVNITFFHGLKVTTNPHLGRNVFLIVLGAWQCHPVTSLLITMN